MQLPSAPAPKEDEKYYAAFGRFIAAYAAAETAVHMVARKISGLQDARARVLFGGMRIGEVVTRTKALLAKSKRSEKVKSDILSCFAQFDIVGLERDRMVHRYSHYSNGSIIVSNTSTAKHVVHAEEHQFTIGDFLAMHIDCLTIYLRLSRIANPLFKKTDSPGFEKGLFEPWQYKPAPQLPPKKETRRQIAEALLNPPRSFPEKAR
jgi:hypothetical protein